MTEYMDEEGRVSTTTHYQLILEFTPRLSPTAPDPLIVDADVKKKLWDQLHCGQKINVSYATENPLIFLIEGE